MHARLQPPHVSIRQHEPLVAAAVFAPFLLRIAAGGIGTVWFFPLRVDEFYYEDTAGQNEDFAIVRDDARRNAGGNGERAAG